ncbi:MAG TPA: hypothetical protein PLU30_02555 [Verrucomicrobiae bacterium]|nr:hypothetical protein [Verrucomicrobiae bacterium]
MRATCRLPFPLTVAAILCAAPTAHPESANHYLASPEKYEGKSVKLDVRVVRPVRWTSPLEGIRFFHAFTEDKQHNALAGAILVAVPSSAAERFVGEYSLSATAHSETLRGILRSVSTRNKRVPRVYLVDYGGQCADILAKNRGVALDADAASP